MLAHRHFQRECRRELSVRTEEQVTDCEPSAVGDPPLCQMTQPVVQQVTTLAERAQILRPIVGRVTVKMCGGKNDTRHSGCGRFHQVRPPSRPPTTVPPGSSALVEPAPVRQTAHHGKMRSGTALTSSSSTLEANAVAQFAPVWWVEGT